MFTTTAKKVVEVETSIEPVLMEFRVNGGRVEFAPSDDLDAILPEFSLSLSPELCAEIMQLPEVRAKIKAEAKRGGRNRSESLAKKFETKK